jgi:hypothetical protein
MRSLALAYTVMAILAYAVIALLPANSFAQIRRG